MANIATESSEAALWGRLLELADTELPPEAARYLLRLRFPESDLNRVHLLAEQARAGDPSETERIDLDCYERVGHALSLMKSRARRALTHHRAA